MTKNRSTTFTESCKTCVFWKNEQSELEYVRHYGICVASEHKFRTTRTVENDVMILDRENRSVKHMGVQRLENVSTVVPIGQVEPSRYCLVTGESFVCLHYDQK